MSSVQDKRKLRADLIDSFLEAERDGDTFRGDQIIDSLKALNARI